MESFEEEDCVIAYKLELEETEAHCKILQNFDGIVNSVPADVNVLLLHGYTGTSADMVDTATYILRHHFCAASSNIKVRFILPDAPYRVAKHSRSWWKISDFELVAGMIAINFDFLKWLDPAGLENSSAYVQSVLDEMGVACDSKMVIAGFSQGSLVATNLALKCQNGPAGLAIFSGILVDQNDWRTSARLKRRTLSVLQCHGTADRILNYASGRELFAMFAAADVEDLTFISFSGGHTITRECEDGFAELIASVYRHRHPARKAPSSARVCTVKDRDVKLKDITYREALPAALREGQIEITGCNFDTLVSDPHIVKLTSDEATSTSIFATGKLNFTFKNSDSSLQKANRDVFLKLTFNAKDPSFDNSAIIERQVYARLVTHLLDTLKTPNLIAFFDFYRCSNMNRVWRMTTRQMALAKPFTKQLADAVRSLKLKLKLQLGIDPNLYDFDTLEVLILELGKGSRLSEVNMKNAFNDSAVGWFSFLVQMLYTIECFNRVGLRHNDLHLGNIFLEDGFTPHIILYFISETEYYALPIFKLAKIFDFDFSYVNNPKGKDLINNRLEKTGEDVCRKTGTCNEPNPKFDAFTLLSLLWIYNQMDMRRRRPAHAIPATVINFIESVIQQKLLIRPSELAGRLCKLNAAGKCDGNYIPTDEEMLPVFEILRRIGPALKNETGERIMFSLSEFDQRYLPLLNEPCDFIKTRVFSLPNVNRRKIEASLMKLTAQNIQPVQFLLEPSDLSTSSGKRGKFGAGLLTGLALGTLGRPLYYGRFYPRRYYGWGPYPYYSVPPPYIY